MDTPAKPSRPRSSSVARRRENSAGIRSNAGYTAVETMAMSMPARTAAAKGASSKLRSVARDSPIRLATVSSSTRGTPMPGKCFAVAATPPAWSALAKAVPSRATFAGSRE